MEDLKNCCLFRSAVVNTTILLPILCQSILVTMMVTLPHARMIMALLATHQDHGLPLPVQGRGRLVQQQDVLHLHAPARGRSRSAVRWFSNTISAVGQQQSEPHGLMLRMELRVWLAPRLSHVSAHLHRSPCTCTVTVQASWSPAATHYSLMIPGECH